MEKTTLPQDRFTSVKGIRTRYWAEGDKGTPVLLVHGLGGFIENWMYNIIPLAEQHRVYAVDLLGFGQTDKTPLIHDINIVVRFIHDFMETVKIDKASLIGNSLGGGLVLQFTLDYPEKVDNLVLVDNAGMGRDVISVFSFCSLPVLGELFIKPNPKKSVRLLEKIIYDAALITPELKELSYRYASGTGAPEALLAALRTGINICGQKGKLTRQLLDRLHTVKAPTLVIWGKQDRIIPVSHAQIAVKNISGARLELFDKCSHMPMYEHPEKFNRLVLEFLK
jgi:4,5:9,10-diseco-3-hydroxy-5,9,17-trioxoandrosta-1(10),2-diene-4-oate hydrolase